MGVVAVVVGSVVLLFGVLFGAPAAINAIWPPEPETILEYCERTISHQWELDQCVWVYSQAD